MDWLNEAVLETKRSEAKRGRRQKIMVFKVMLSLGGRNGSQAMLKVCSFDRR